MSPEPPTQRGHDAAPSGRKRRAVVTIVHDEPVFFPIWLEYYSRFFAADDIYVFDHETTDGSTSREGFHRIPVTHDRFDNMWMVHTVEDKQNELLETYDVVLVTDSDEIVATDPAWGTLGEYIDQFDQPFVTTQGYELIHTKDEPPLDWDRPILEQRHHWFRSYAYDKPILAMEPLSWLPGFHALRTGEFVPDERLFLVHLHRMDYEVCMQRHRERRKMQWNKRDLDGNWGAHYRLWDDAELEDWFYNQTGIPNWPVNVETMPPQWESLILRAEPPQPRTNAVENGANANKLRSP